MPFRSTSLTISQPGETLKVTEITDTLSKEIIEEFKEHAGEVEIISGQK